MFQSKLFLDALADNAASLPLRAERLIVAQAGDKSVVSCRNLQVEHFAQLELCDLKPVDEPRPNSYRYWGGEEHDRLYTSYDQVVWEVLWNGNQLRAVHVEWENSCGGDSRDWVVADSADVAESFILEVERKTHAPGEAILTFREGDWQRNYELYAATQAASFEDLILADDMKTRIRRDFSQFLESEERYTDLGIAWRRGALLIGPPGNGKTHCVRALVKELDIASLYVQSLRHRYYTDEQMWQRVFNRARGLTPCVLVLEDLDSLVDEENRSFFLNQLDGFQQNHGLVVLATTNHPERIDSAIIDRPSRFDRKYYFDLPTREQRAEFLSSWQQQLASGTGWKPEEVDSIANQTQSFSFAYLKELVVSAVMEWMQNTQASFLGVLTSQMNVLRQQLRAANSENDEKSRQESTGRRRMRPTND